MGHGYYSVDDRATRAASLSYGTKSAREIFTQRSINNAMNPHGIRVREARDSAEHPNSVAIILALDVTGSMGSIPHHLVKEGLPKIMGRIIQSGTPDPQLLFLAVGDHECDNSPLQVGQFESNDELLDKWLTDVYLEGGGGGNAGESYLLAWYFAGFHTSIDCFEKRQQKGFLFTIGDEPTLLDVPAQAVKHIMGDGQYENYSASVLLDRARELYHVFHLHIRQTSAGSNQQTMDGWKQLMGNQLIILDRHEDVSKVIPELIAETMRTTAKPAAPSLSTGLAETSILL
ncbi:MAG: hypothetical protein CDV28_10172 [Candidatus Electronema aureum]|uniref:von Willebrand factor type A domain-containing protein n=1 Tax=Candidatus Electronema aureum TaxID=2005002 RepID=A0A521G571_9BACT|nr:MAG: hypothetical protein CDV28_10172 [Candidatus Electronema aureum]